MTRIIKRLIDLTTALFVLILLAPVMALVAMAIRIILGRPVFFREIHPGYRAKPFTLYNFRTTQETYDNLKSTPRPDAAAMLRALLDVPENDAPPPQLLALWLGVMGAVALRGIGPRSRAALLARQWRNPIYGREQFGDVADDSPRRRDRERGTFAVYQHLEIGQQPGGTELAGVIGLATVTSPRRNAVMARAGTPFTLSYAGVWKHNRL